MNENAKKLTLTDLIAKKEAIAKAKNETKEIYVKSLDAIITIKKPDRTIINKVTENEKKADIVMVYECVIEPNLKDAALKETYEVKFQIDVVEKILDAGEITHIAGICTAFGGYKDSIEELKKK